MPFLVNLENSDLPRHSPLTQFQTTSNNKADIHRMIHSINRAAQPQVVEDSVLDTLFEAVWDRLDRPLREAIEHAGAEPSQPVRPVGVGEMVGEILALVRGQQRELADLSAEVGMLRSAYRLRSILAESRAVHTAPVNDRDEIDQRVNELFRESGRKPTVAEVASCMNIDPIELAGLDLALDEVERESGIIGEPSAKDRLDSDLEGSRTARSTS